jgi:hypothetical protein
MQRRVSSWTCFEYWAYGAGRGERNTFAIRGGMKRRGRLGRVESRGRHVYPGFRRALALRDLEIFGSSGECAAEGFLHDHAEAISAERSFEFHDAVNTGF